MMKKQQTVTPRSPFDDMFSGRPMHDSFCAMAELLPSVTMPASTRPFQFEEGHSIELPTTYGFNGRECSTDEFLRSTATSALLVINDGKVAYEDYQLTGGRDVHWISWSVAKSFMSAAIGIAVGEGQIRSVNDLITSYAPSLIGSAYDGVRIKDVLQMSSGARWSEDYGDRTADVHRFGAAMRAGSLDEFVRGMVPELEPGTVHRDNTADTQALGMLLVEATGRGIADYMHEKLWEPLGMEADGSWLVDGEGREIAGAGLNLIARDYAKLGELYRCNGAWRGVQIVPSSWIDASVHPDGAHVDLGMVELSDNELPAGYGFHWWLFGGESYDYAAVGIYNQFVYVDPCRGVVIVKLSANEAYGTADAEAVNREAETVAFFRSVSTACLASPFRA